MDFKTNQQLIFVLSAVYLVLVEGKASVGEWTVKNKASNVCMKMKMAATLTIPYATFTGQSNAVVNVPTSADPTDYSKCEGDSVSFTLNFFYPKWEVYLDYKKSGSQYKLDTIGVGWTIDEHFPDATGGGWFSVSTSDSSLPKTDIGKYYGCDNITFDVSGVTLALSDVKFQPYVQEVSDKGYGELAVCTTNNGLSQAVAIVIVVAAALVIIVSVVITIVCVVRRRRQNRQFDYQQQ